MAQLVTTEPAAEIEAEPVSFPRQPPFQPEEVAAFHAEDRHAAAAIVAIIGSIATLALVAYTFISLWVTSYPHR